jgi:ABC-2 type transport system permease protein
MNSLATALWVETLKARRTPLTWLSGLAIALAPLIGGLFMLIVKEPAWARRVGLLATKAQLRAEQADWPTYAALLAQAVAVGGLFVFGLIVCWIFGREYADGTLMTLLAVPTPRWMIVAAKFMVVAIWVAALTLLVGLLGLAIGLALALPGGSLALTLATAARLLLVAALLLALVAPVAWVACAGGGYLPPVGAIGLVAVLAQIVAALGWGGLFPWSVPALVAGLAGPEAAALGPTSYLLVILTGLAGLAGTIAWWALADQP